MLNFNIYNYNIIRTNISTVLEMETKTLTNSDITSDTINVKIFDPVSLNCGHSKLFYKQ